MKENYIRLWLRDFWGIFTHELKTIFCDGGVLIIFFVAGLGYPLLYNLVYRNGILEDTPIAVVDRPVPPPMATILGPRSHWWRVG